MLQSKNLRVWKESKVNPFERKVICPPHFILNIKKKIIFFIQKNIKKFFRIYDKNLKQPIKKILIKRKSATNNFLYAPNILRFNKNFICFIQVGKIVKAEIWNY